MWCAILLRRCTIRRTKWASKMRRQILSTSSATKRIGKSSLSSTHQYFLPLILQWWWIFRAVTNINHHHHHHHKLGIIILMVKLPIIISQITNCLFSPDTSIKPPNIQLASYMTKTSNKSLQLRSWSQGFFGNMNISWQYIKQVAETFHLKLMSSSWWHWWKSQMIVKSKINPQGQ